MTPMRAAIYARRSTEEHQEASLEIQISEAKRFIERKGWSLDQANIFIDDAVSRAEFKKRPGLLKMILRAEQKAFDVVVMRDETRLGGDVIRVGVAIQEILEAGARIYYHFTDEEVRLDGAIDKFMCSARNFASELEREKIASRTREHLENKARRGLVVGGKIYGYDNVGVFEGEKRVRVEYKVNVAQAATIREVFERYARGEGLKSIAKDLNARGIPSPRGKGWAQSALSPMTQNERYRGVLTWGRQAKGYRAGTKVRRPAPEAAWTKVTSEELRIISEELWQGVQGRMAKRASFVGSKKGGTPAKHLLVGLGRCASCGGRLAVTNGRSSYEAVKVYVCANFREKGPTACSNSLRRPVPVVDAAVLSWIEENILNELIVAQVLAEVRRRLQERAASSGPQVDELEAQAKKLRAEIAKLGEAILLAEGGGMAHVVKMLGEREKSLSSIEARLASMSVAPQVLDLEVRRLEREASKRLSDLRGLLSRRPEEAKVALEALLSGPLAFSPISTPEGHRFEVTGQAALGGMNMGVPSGGHHVIPLGSIKLAA